MSAIGALLSLVSITYAVLWISSRVRGGIAADILGEVRRQWDMLTGPVRSELPAGVYPVAVTLSPIGIFYGSHALGSTLTPMVLLIGIPVYVLGVLARGGASILGVGLSRIVSRQELRADGFKIPLSIFSSSGSVSEFSSVVSLPEYRSIGLFGATRSGKTTTLRGLLDQIDPRGDDGIVVYDHKDDYREHFESRGYEIERLTTSGGNVRWNLFREIESEADADEIARAIFPTESGDATADHFQDKARQAFAAIIKFLDRELEHPTNADLVRFLQRNDGAEIYEQIEGSRWDDLQRAVDPFDPNNRSNEGSGIESTLSRVVLDTFVGEFGDGGPGDLPEFSVREYVNSPRGRVMVLDHPQGEGERVKPIFRFMLDRAADMALADETDRGAYFVLDEFARIPGLRHIEELVNVGAAKNVQVFAALQSVSQLYENYGERAGESILAGLVSSVILRVNDQATAEHARGTIGTSFTEYTKHVDRDKDVLTGGMTETRRETKREEEHAFAAGDLRRFDPGEAVIVRPDGWVHGQIEEPAE